MLLPFNRLKKSSRSRRQAINLNQMAGLGISHSGIPKGEHLLGAGSEDRLPEGTDVYWIAKEKLLVGRLRGVLDAKTAEQIVEFTETKEILCQSGFNRFCDFSKLEGVQLSSYEIIQLAARRLEFNPNELLVRSAFYAIDPLAFGIARMYEQVLKSPRIEVRVWDDIQEAAGWLGVELDSLICAGKSSS